MKEHDHQPLFKELDHTADLRVEIHGKDEQDLFRNAVGSLYALLGLPVVSDLGCSTPEDRLSIRGQDGEEVLVRLLGELLYRASVERRQLIADTLLLRRDDEGGCEAIVTGRWHTLENEAMAGRLEIKAVTYHDVEIRRTQEGFSARVVLDI